MNRKLNYVRGLCWSEVTDWKLTSVWPFHHCETKILRAYSSFYSGALPPSNTNAGSLSAFCERREKLAVPMTRWRRSARIRCLGAFPSLEWPNPETFWNQASGWTLFTSPWGGGAFAISHLGATAAAAAAFWATFVPYCEHWSCICCIFQGPSQSVASPTLRYRVYVSSLFPVRQTVVYLSGSR